MSTWILLRGLTRESRHWGNFPGIFCREVPSAGVYAPNLPGNGDLCAQPSPSRVDAMMADVRAQLISQGIAPPYHLLAMSLGAMVAVAWAARHPDEIRGCVLINTSLRPFSPFYRRLRPGSYARLLKLALFGGSARDWESSILDLTSRHAVNADETLQDWIAYRQQYPVSAHNAWRQLLAAARYRAPLAKPDVPILILASRNDALVDPSCSRQLAINWPSGFAEHPTAGHDLPLDDGPWVARQVALWVSNLAGKTQQGVTPVG